MPAVATDSIVVSTNYAYDTFDNVVDKNGQPTALPTDRDVVIDSVALAVDSIASSLTTLTWEIVLDVSGNESVSGELTDLVVVGAAATGKVFRASPVRVRLSAQPRLRVKGNTGSCNVVGKMTYHVPKD